MSFSKCMQCGEMVNRYEKYCDNCIKDYGLKQDETWHRKDANRYDDCETDEERNEIDKFKRQISKDECLEIENFKRQKEADHIALCRDQLLGNKKTVKKRRKVTNFTPKKKKRK